MSHIVQCSNCDAQITKDTRSYNQSKSKRFFCNRSCSVSFNNRVVPRRTLSNKCKLCNVPIKSQLMYCKDHTPKKQDYNNLTYEELTQSAKYQKSAIIRTLARRTYFASNDKTCKRCGYDKHVEVCHIKPIKSHSTKTKLSQINDINNLIGLCPNCHWELDSGLFTL